MYERRTEEIINLLMHHVDMTYQKIGEIVGCSRQRVHKVAKRTGLTHGRLKRNKLLGERKKSITNIPRRI